MIHVNRLDWLPASEPPEDYDPVLVYREGKGIDVGVHTRNGGWWRRTEDDGIVLALFDVQWWAGVERPRWCGWRKLDDAWQPGCSEYPSEWPSKYPPDWCPHCGGAVEEEHTQGANRDEDEK